MNAQEELARGGGRAGAEPARPDGPGPGADEEDEAKRAKAAAATKKAAAPARKGTPPPSKRNEQQTGASTTKRVKPTAGATGRAPAVTTTKRAAAK